MSGIATVRRALRALSEIPPPDRPLPQAIVEAGEPFARGRIHRLTTFPDRHFPCLVVQEDPSPLVVLSEDITPPSVMNLGVASLRESLFLFLDLPEGAQSEAYVRVDSLRVADNQRITDLVSVTERMRLYHSGMPVEPVQVYPPIGGGAAVALGHGLHRAVAASQLEAEYLRATVHLDRHSPAGPRPVAEVPFPSIPQRLVHLSQAHWAEARRQALRQDFMDIAASMTRFLYMGVSEEDRDTVLKTGLKPDFSSEADPIEQTLEAFNRPYLALYDRTVHSAGDRARSFRYLIECATGRVWLSQRFD